MDDKTKRELELHIAGATVRHQSPFERLVHYESDEFLNEEFIEKWVIPFYMASLNQTKFFIQDYSKIRGEITVEITKKLFGEFNWRTRIVGAYFSAIENYVELEEIIGIHLLKSEVCYAGRGYCLALATFNTATSQNYIKRYLEYYLTRSDLYFDQSIAMAALNWMDMQNGTNEMQGYLNLWDSFDNKKQRRDLNWSIEFFNGQIEKINQIKNC